jgi:hypothetical protein
MTLHGMDAGELVLHAVSVLACFLRAATQSSLTSIAEPRADPGRVG